MAEELIKDWFALLTLLFGHEDTASNKSNPATSFGANFQGKKDRVRVILQQELEIWTMHLRNSVG